MNTAVKEIGACQYCTRNLIDRCHSEAEAYGCPNFQVRPRTEEKINHPPHYGGEDNPYEAIKVIEAWNLDFNLGNAIKYISRADKKINSDGSIIEDLSKAMWYLNRAIQRSGGTGYNIK